MVLDRLLSVSLTILLLLICSDVNAEVISCPRAGGDTGENDYYAKTIQIRHDKFFKKRVCTTGKVSLNRDLFGMTGLFKYFNLYVILSDEWNSRGGPNQSSFDGARVRFSNGNEIDPIVEVVCDGAQVYSLPNSQTFSGNSLAVEIKAPDSFLDPESKFFCELEIISESGTVFTGQLARLTFDGKTSYHMSKSEFDIHF